MQKPASGGVQVINATAPLGPVQGKAPIVYALPGLVGHRDKLREALAEAWKGRGDAVFLVPASNKTAVVWRVFWEKGLIRLIEEYQPFADAKSLVDTGLGDEANRDRIISRLSEPTFLAHVAKLKLPDDINAYNLLPLPAEGVSIQVGPNALILSIAERDPTYFDLAATPFIDDRANISKTAKYSMQETPQLSHSGDIGFTSTQAPARTDKPGPAVHMQVLAHSIRCTAPVPTFAVTVSGYSNTALIRFEKWRPTVAAIDHATRTIYYCGVRLDQATAGTNTVCVVMICRPQGKETVHISPLPGPYGMGDVNALPPDLKGVWPFLHEQRVEGVKHSCQI